MQVYAMVLKEIMHEGRTLFRDVSFSHEHQVLDVDAHNLARSASSLQEGLYIWLVDTPHITCNFRNIMIE
jgi:hypothetical protein